MIETAATFKSKHSFSKELQRDLEELLYTKGFVPREVTVRSDIFNVMRREVGGVGASLRISLQRQPTNQWGMPELLSSSNHFVVTILPEDK